MDEGPSKLDSRRLKMFPCLRLDSYRNILLVGSESTVHPALYLVVRWCEDLVTLWAEQSTWGLLKTVPTIFWWFTKWFLQHERLLCFLLCVITVRIPPCFRCVSSGGLLCFHCVQTVRNVNTADTDNIAEILTQLIVFVSDSISDSHAPFFCFCSSKHQEVKQPTDDCGSKDEPQHFMT